MTDVYVNVDRKSPSICSLRNEWRMHLRRDRGIPDFARWLSSKIGAVSVKTVVYVENDDGGVSMILSDSAIIGHHYRIYWNSEKDMTYAMMSFEFIIVDNEPS